MSPSDAPPYPDAYQPEQVGHYEPVVEARGGQVFDEVLEYRVWCCVEQGAEDLDEGNDYFYAFDRYAEAERYAAETLGTEAPVALVLQRAYLEADQNGHYTLIEKERLAEWPVSDLAKAQRTPERLQALLGKPSKERGN